VVEGSFAPDPDSAIASLGDPSPAQSGFLTDDYSLGPSEVLGPAIRAKGGFNDAKVYPAFGDTPQQGHGGFAVGGGVPIWSPDVFAFLDRILAAPEEAEIPSPKKVR
jgi:hypothetical protein